MRDLTERRRIQPRAPRITVGIPDEDVAEITSMSQLGQAQTDKRPILARATDGVLHTVRRENPPRGDC